MLLLSLGYGVIRVLGKGDNMKISVTKYSDKYAKVLISHDSVNFDFEMLSKHELEEFLLPLSEAVEDIKDVLKSLKE